MSIFIEFDQDDISDMVAPLMQRAEEAAANGEQGIVFAQVFDHSMRALFIEHEWAKEIQDVFRRRGEALRAKKATAARAEE